jgi:hypothetical protein
MRKSGDLPKTVHKINTFGGKVEIQKNSLDKVFS